ncbi:MAG: hypothetical protein IJ226_02890, partial [Clostridia bacterium]|nr:hypothetical protein [Clostridia bacterium]
RFAERRARAVHEFPGRQMRQNRTICDLRCQVAFLYNKIPLEIWWFLICRSRIPSVFLSKNAVSRIQSKPSESECLQEFVRRGRSAFKTLEIFWVK